MPNVRAVTVYAGSSTRATEEHLRLARELGEGIARQGWAVVYGGANVGLMGALADAALDAGGRVEGVILDTFARVGLAARASGGCFSGARPLLQEGGRDAAPAASPRELVP